MCGNNPKYLLILLMVLLTTGKAFAQDVIKTDLPEKRNKSFQLTVGGGLSYYTAAINNEPIGIQTNVVRSGPAATIRVMWQPQFRLRLGIETGFTNFYSYSLKNGSINGKLDLSAIPILVTWSMPVVKRVRIYAGFGSYFLTSHLNYTGKVKSTTFSLGSNIALSYVQPISKNVGIAVEGKWANAFETKDNALSLQLHFCWTFLEW